MVSKECLKRIDERSYLTEREHKEFLSVIKKELKALEIIKNKKVNIFHIWVFDDYEQYKEHYPFAEYNAEEDMLAFEEFDLLKGILNDEQ